MDNMNQNPQRQPNPRRRKRDPKRVFMEAYFPVILFVGIIILIIVGVVSCSQSKEQRQKDARKESLAAEEADQEKKSAHDEEARTCIEQAKAVAATYDFKGAIAVLDAFQGNIYDYDEMLQLRDSYESILENLVEYSLEDVVNLSVQVLIHEADRAFSDPDYSSGYKKNFITTEEFSNMLQQLYANGYVLVSMDDLVDEATDEAGNTAYTAKTVSLPQGKKPLMLTQTQVNYYTYMVDPDGDGVADANGAGFASKLILENGQLKNEMVTSTGDTVTGNFDMVPILEDFIASHPDFSYQGARATLAVTGYNGIFGYRDNQLSEVTPVLEALRNTGYTVAFYTYANSDYSASTAEEIRSEIRRWNENIVPVLGETSVIVFARSADIAEPGSYSGDKFNALYEGGFRYYLGFCSDGTPWCTVDSTYIRQGRLIVSADNLSSHPEWYTGIFDPATVLVETR